MAFAQPKTDDLESSGQSFYFDHGPHKFLAVLSEKVNTYPNYLSEAYQYSFSLLMYNQSRIFSQH